LARRGFPFFNATFTTSPSARSKEASLTNHLYANEFTFRSIILNLRTTSYVTPESATLFSLPGKTRTHAHTRADEQHGKHNKNKNKNEMRQIIRKFSLLMGLGRVVWKYCDDDNDSDVENQLDIKVESERERERDRHFVVRDLPGKQR
jgi:hypothetical protein